MAPLRSCCIQLRPEYRPRFRSQNGGSFHVYAAQADDGSEFSQNYSLNVLWLDKSMGLAVDQVFKGVRASQQEAIEYRISRGQVLQCDQSVNDSCK